MTAPTLDRDEFLAWLRGQGKRVFRRSPQRVHNCLDCPLGIYLGQEARHTILDPVYPWAGKFMWAVDSETDAGSLPITAARCAEILEGVEP